jgi:ATP/ADP translocase
MSTLLAALKTERGRHVGAAAGLAGFSAAFLFCGYEFIRSPIESIFIENFGAAAKPYALSCVPLMMFLLIYIYGRTLSAFGAARSMAASMALSGLAFIFCYLFLGSLGKPLVFMLYIFKESYVVIIAEQYWSFINSVLRDSEGKVFNGPVAGLGALGSLTGGFLLGRYAVRLHTESFILLSALCFIPALVLMWKAYGRAGEPNPEPEEAGGRKGHLHLGILKENRTVLFIALIIFSVQVVATALDLRFSLLVQDAFSDKDLRTAFLGGFWMKVNIFSFSMQFLLTPILLRYIPVRGIQAGIPIVHLCACACLFFYPSLALASAAFLLFKGLDYSIFRASKETLYIPFSYDTRYRAKQVADAFAYRFSKGVTSVAFSLARSVGVVPVAVYAATGFVFSAVWLGLAFPLTSRREK